MNIVLKVLAIMLPIFLGYFFKHIKIFDRNDIISIRKFVVKVTVPFIIFRNLYQANMETLSQLIPLALSFIIMTFLFSLSGFILSRLFSNKITEQNAYIFSVFMGNYGYLGWGVMAYFFGDPGFTRAVFFSMLFWPVFLTAGFSLEFISSKSTRGKDQIIKLLIHNGAAPILVSLTAILLNIINIPLPEVIKEFIGKFAAITIPTILFTIGLNFQLKLDRKHIKLILCGAMHRVVFGFIIGLTTLFAIKTVFSIDSITGKVILMQSIMPTAVLSTFYAAYVLIDEKIQAGIITFSNIFSLITIPIAFYLVNLIF